MLSGLAAQAQVQVESAIDSISILVGQQTHLVLSVTAPKNARLQMPRYKAQQMLTPGVEVIDDHQADTSEVDNNLVKVTRRYTLTSFDQRLYYLPPMTVKVNGKPYKSRSLALKVLTVDVDTLHLNKFYPPKDVQDNPFDWNEWSPIFYLSILLVLVLLAAYYLYLRMKDNKPILLPVKIVNRLLPHQKAMKEIEELKADRTATTENVKEYYTKLTDTLRKYIEERFGFNAMEMTSSEIIQRLRGEQDQQKIDELKMLFETADLVKFAKYSTLINENDLNLVNAVNFINSTKLDKPPVEEPAAPKLSEKDLRSMRSRKALKVSVICMVCGAAAILAYVIWQIWQLLM